MWMKIEINYARIYRGRLETSECHIKGFLVFSVKSKMYQLILNKK